MNTKSKILGVIVISILILALGITSSYLMKSNNKVKETEVKLSEVDSLRNDIQVKYDSAVIKLDDLVMRNDNLQTQNSSLQNEINTTKIKIKKLLRQQKVTKKQLLIAAKLMKGLSADISKYEKEIKALKAENKKLQDQNQALVMQNNQLEKVLNKTKEEKQIAEEKVDLGSTLTVSNVSAQALNKNNHKTKITQKAEKLKMSFVINENRISPTTNKTIYLVMTNPFGDVAKSKINSDVLSTKKDGEKLYTGKVQVDYVTGMIQTVDFVVEFENVKVDGVHKIELYENGYKISESKLVLKKRKILGFL